MDCPPSCLLPGTSPPPAYAFHAITAAPTCAKECTENSIVFSNPFLGQSSHRVGTLVGTWDQASQWPRLERGPSTVTRHSRERALRGSASGACYSATCWCGGPTAASTLPSLWGLRMWQRQFSFKNGLNQKKFKKQNPSSKEILTEILHHKESIITLLKR